MLSCQSGKFTIPEKITYLNGAYMSPMLKDVEKVGIRNLRRKRNPVEITPEEFFTDSELLRKEYAKLINASPADIAIISSVSYGISTIAKNLNINKEQNFIVVKDEFPSNYYSWESMCKTAGAELRIVSPENTIKNRGKNWNEKILQSIDSSTYAVAISNVHWADGTIFDLQAIRKRTKEVGALLVIDGTQSVGALPFDVQLIQPDALICAGYKWLLGPYSIGLAYFGDYFKNGKPLEENWINRLDSEDFNALVNYQSAYQPGALRYEVGEHSNFILVPMLLRAVTQLNRWTPHQVQEYCQHITGDAIKKLIEYGYWVEEGNYRASHLFGIRLSNPEKLSGIKEALLKKKIYISYRGDAMRISPNIYNDAMDVHKLVKVLISFAGK
jgi:selenocysteine lyase/cysteine desulfurase